LLIENCAAGGGRGDLLMDSVFGRINRSDNQDPLDVLKMHEGFTWLHPSKLAGGACHISDGFRNMNLRSRTVSKYSVRA
jgi:alpha-galactosidase